MPSRQVTQLTKGFTLMQAQLKMAKGGVTKLEGDKFADVVEPFLDKAKVLWNSHLDAGVAFVCWCVRAAVL